MTLYVHFKAARANDPTLSDSLNLCSEQYLLKGKSMCFLVFSLSVSFANPMIYWLYGRRTQSLLQSKDRKDPTLLD